MIYMKVLGANIKLNNTQQMSIWDSIIIQTNESMLCTAFLVQCEKELFVGVCCTNVYNWLRILFGMFCSWWSWELKRVKNTLFLTENDNTSKTIELLCLCLFHFIDII